MLPDHNEVHGNKYEAVEYAVDKYSVSIYGATALSFPMLPSGDASILCLLLISSILVFLESVMCPSRQDIPLLVLHYEISH